MTTPLLPRGTLRSRFVSSTKADLFRKIGAGAQSCDLGDEGLYLAEELVAADRWLGDADAQALAILVLALMIAQRQGSTRLPLDPKRGPLRTLVQDINRVAKLDLDVPRVLKTITELTRTGRFTNVVGARDARLPLVVDYDALYTERSRWLEQRVATRLAERLTAPVRDVAAVVEDLARRPGLRPLSDEQRAAVGLALGGTLAVVTGGPGTGKTVVAAAIVRGLARLGITHVALAAQTGKAANRLTEVIGEQLAAIADPAEADRILAVAPPAAQTLHRLLGYRGGRFAHHAQSPLPVGAVIIDEASMIDLELVDALLDALPASAPLILIGDAHQLPAIDAGQLLADLAAGAGDAAAAAADGTVAVTQSSSGLAGARVAVLAKSFRMDTSDVHGRAVYDAAQAIHAGTAAALFDKAHALATPRTPGTLQFRGAEWVDPAAAPRAQDVTLAVATALWHHFDGAKALRAGERVFRFHEGQIDDAQRAELEHLWHLLGRARILTVTRALPTGAVAINDHVHELALDRLSVTGRPDFVPGEPVMITANDYQRGLFNGDQGIVVRADVGGPGAAGRHKFMALFRSGGELRPFAIEALRDRLELAWALTVHKSQGSELDAVALLLPHEDLPLVTRELLYTGITRARSGVVICGSKKILTAGAARRALRESGLGDRLRATLRT
ncbi:MAG: exodeoxyribonuclease V subunit alpha [Myxococcota bacterium]|nr:exodeoxyribonuclease V subunit alpha [Myxococcota bacterium]